MARPKSESGPPVDEQEKAFERLKKRYAAKDVHLVISSANPSDRWGEYRRPKKPGDAGRVVIFRNKINRDVLENRNYGSKRTLLSRLNGVIGHEYAHALQADAHGRTDHGPAMRDLATKTIKFAVDNKPRNVGSKLNKPSPTGANGRLTNRHTPTPNATPRPRPTATPKPKG